MSADEVKVTGPITLHGIHAELFVERLLERVLDLEAELNTLRKRAQAVVDTHGTPAAINILAEHLRRAPR